jgi:hypothetical protein
MNDISKEKVMNSRICSTDGGEERTDLFEKKSEEQERERERERLTF